MTAKTASDFNVKTRVDTLDPAVVLSAEVEYAGALIAGGSQNNTTAANRGYSYAFNDAAGNIPLGFSTDEVTGDGTLTGKHYTGAHVRRVAVTGLGGAVTDNWKLVYATDDNTFTVTATEPNLPIGYIHEYDDSSYAWVFFFGQPGWNLLAMAGGAREPKLLGIVAAEAATGDAATGIVMKNHGIIESVYGIVIRAMGTTSDDLDINLEIGGTNVTGGVIEWLGTDALAAKKSGTAITANNIFHGGDLVDIEVVANNAGTTGLLAVYANLHYMPGI